MRVEVSNIGELPETNRMGHTCASLNGDLLFIWGGTDEPMNNQQQEQANNGQPNGQHQNHFHRPLNLPTGTKSSKVQHIWIYDTLTGYWRRRLCSGECPPQLVSTSSTLIGQQMYIFGGHSPLHDNWLNCLYRLDLDTFEWRDLGSQSGAEPTKPIRSDKCVSWTHRGRLYVFGGYGWAQVEHLPELLDRQKDLQLVADQRWPKFGWNNQLVEYNPLTSTWHWPSYSGKCPSARAAHSGALMGDTFFLFGGRDSRERLNDLYTLDMTNLTWNQLSVISDPLPLDRAPIRHLLEGVENEHESANQQDQQLVDTETDDLMVESDEPAPSSSGYVSRQIDVEIEDEEEDDDDDDDDDDFEGLRPSTFSERHSLPHLEPTSREGYHLCDDQVKCSSQQTNVNSQQTVQNHHQDQPNEDEVSNDVQEHLDESLNDHHHQQQQQPVQDPSARKNPIPVGRSFASFTPISANEILLYGGVSSQDENLSDSWLYHTGLNRWTKAELRVKHARLWHTGARTSHNEVIIIGGSCSDRVDEFCSDVLIISKQPKCLKRLALDSLARSVKMRCIKQVENLPSVLHKLIKLRKQAMALTMARPIQAR